VTELGLLAVGVLLTLGTAVFVAAEFSLVALDRPTVEAAVERGERGAGATLAAVRGLSTQLSGAQVGITLTTLAVGFLVEPSVAALLEPGLAALGLGEQAARPASVVIGLVLATLFSMLVGELVPQNLAISAPLRTALLVAPPQRAFTTAVAPLIRVLNGCANALVRAVGAEPMEELPSGRSAEELAFLVRRSAEAGTLDLQTAARLTRSLRFSDRTAADAMTPRVRVQVLRREETATALVALAARTGHSRFPVIDEDIDDVVGVAHVKRAVAVPRERRHEAVVSELMSDVLRVPETVRLERLLVDLRGQGLQLAVVVDEYGGTAGVLTLEDVVEEIVGEVADEHDRSRVTMVRRPDGSWLVPGLMRPDEVRDRVAVQLPDSPAYETVGGLVMAMLGRVPAVGDEVEVDRAVLRVERMDGRRVDRVRIFAPATPDAPAPNGAS
jgi:CBS domain containing-hemolysin-like protein